uniref:hypothetical protein n=1 Tax=Solidesulfovibrio alcoholivorans TaxID=81406 RepID=UPI001B806830
VWTLYNYSTFTSDTNLISKSFIVKTTKIINSIYSISTDSDNCQFVSNSTANNIEIIVNKIHHVVWNVSYWLKNTTNKTLDRSDGGSKR